MHNGQSDGENGRSPQTSGFSSLREEQSYKKDYEIGANLKSIKEGMEQWHEGVLPRLPPSSLPETTGPGFLPLWFIQGILCSLIVTGIFGKGLYEIGGKVAAVIPGIITMMLISLLRDRSDKREKRKKLELKPKRKLITLS